MSTPAGIGSNDSKDRSPGLRRRRPAVLRPEGAASATDSVAFGRDRLALFGKVGFWLDLAFLVVANIAVVASGAVSPGGLLTLPGNIFQAITVLLFGLTWALCRYLPVGRRMLGVLDAGTTILVSIVLCISAMAQPDGVSVHPTVLSLTNILLARAVLVPSTMWRTLGISLAAGFPVVLVGLAQSHAMPQPMALPGNRPELQAAFISIWVVLACALASVASRVIFGLRREVAEARRLGQYTLERKISEGGMGEIWLARHALLRRPTALKLLRTDRSSRADDLRFEREVRLTARLTHPNTVAIYDHGRTDEGVFYYAMEYLDGVNLQELVESDGPLPPGRIIHVLRQACGSLAEAHGHGLIHRDIKPANIILCERGALLDVAKVVDFGLVKDVAAAPDLSLSGTGTVAGTPRHMAPEAISSPASITASVDIYGLGTVAYWLSTGEHVFDGETFVHLCAQHLSMPPDPPSTRARNRAPADLEAVILRCLEKHPSRRFRSAQELDAALAACTDATSWSQDDALAWWSRWTALREAHGGPEGMGGVSHEDAPTVALAERHP